MVFLNSLCISILGQILKHIYWYLNTLWEIHNSNISIQPSRSQKPILQKNALYRLKLYMSQSVNKRPSDRCSRPRYINASICPYINWFVLYQYILWDKLHWGIYLCRTWLTHVKSRATFLIHYGPLIPMSFLFLQNGDNVTAKYFFIVVGMSNDFF